MAGMEERSLYGGNMSILLPPCATDVSTLREVPDNQEVFTHESSDQSIIVEILQYVEEPDDQAVRSHFEEIASNNNARGPENSSIVSVETMAMNHMSLPQCSKAYCLFGQQFVAKFNEPAKNALNLWMGLFRLPQFQADIVVTFNDPQNIRLQPNATHLGYDMTAFEGWKEQTAGRADDAQITPSSLYELHMTPQLTWHHQEWTTSVKH